MENGTIPFSIRIPATVAERMDTVMEQCGYYQSKPMFILDSMRKMLCSTFVNLSKVYSMVTETNKSESEMGVFFSSMRMSKDLLIRDMGGTKDMVQILVRVPNGLFQDIENNVYVQKIYEDKLDFTRAAILANLESMEEMLEIKKDIENYDRNLKERQEKGLEDLIKKMEKSKDMPDFVMKLLKDVAKMQKNQEKS